MLIQSNNAEESRHERRHHFHKPSTGLMDRATDRSSAWTGSHGFRPCGTMRCNRSSSLMVLFSNLDPLRVLKELIT